MSHTNETTAVEPVGFTANDGVRWSVRELAANQGDGDGGPCLVFESDAAIRRVRTFPSDWRALGTDALVALSWKT